MKTYNYERHNNKLKLKVKFDFVKSELKDNVIKRNNKIIHSFDFENEFIISLSDTEIKLGGIYLFLDKNSKLAQNIINDFDFKETI